MHLLDDANGLPGRNPGRQYFCSLARLAAEIAPPRGPISIKRLSIGNKDKALVHVLVRDNNVDQALKALKKKMQREGIFREMKLRSFYEKPSEKRAREKAEAVRRARKLARKRAQREGGMAPRKRRGR